MSPTDDKLFNSRRIFRAFQTDFISASLVNIKTGVGIVELGPGYEDHIV